MAQLTVKVIDHEGMRRKSNKYDGTKIEVPDNLLGVVLGTIEDKDIYFVIGRDKESK